MKSRIIKLLNVFLIMFVVLGQFNFSQAAIYKGTEPFTYVKAEEYPFHNKRYDYRSAYRQAKIGDQAAFCIDYGRLIPKQELQIKFQNTMSPQALAVLIYGYPNNVAAELGSNEDEQHKAAYLATQLAFWDVCTKANESWDGLKFYFDDIVPNPGYEDIMSRVIPEAKKLSDLAINAPYMPNPTIEIHSDSDFGTNDIGDKIKVGPYKVTGRDGTNTTDFTVNNIRASLIDAPGSALIVDEAGNSKKDFALGEKIYVIADKDQTSANFELNVEASGSLLSCGAYTANLSGYQTFAAIMSEPTTVAQSTGVTWTNESGNISVIKVDQGNNKIANVKFELRDSSNTKVAEGITNSTGRIDFKNVNTGKYTVQEVSAPEGYVLDTAPKTVVIKAGDTETIDYYNNKVEGGLVINKTDSNGDPLANVTFQILDSNKKVIDTISTNAKGKASIGSLDIGTYYYRETDAPDDVIFDKTLKQFKIEDYSQIVTVDVTNELVKGSLKIVKTDEYGEPLKGVKFDVLDSNKKKIKTITTNASGIAALEETLEIGKYYYKEVSTSSDQLILDDTEHSFEITESKRIVSQKVKNYYKKGNLQILKNDNTGKPIAGVKFEILNNSKEIVDTIITDAEGKASSKSLIKGNYFYREVDAPDNVIINTDLVKFTIKNEDEAVNAEIVNQLIQGKIKIIKKDETGKPIKDVTFQIFDSAQNTVVDTVTTDESGIAISKQLGNGKYYFIETKAPDIYVLDSTQHEFEIKGADDFIQKEVFNKLKKAKLSLLKVDKDTNAPIANVKFEILNQNKDVIGSVVTDNNGKAETQDLGVGTYFYREVNTPDNYVGNTEEVKFDIADDQTVLEKTVTNVAKKLPVTGGFISTNIWIIIIVTVSSVVVYFVVKVIIKKVREE